MPETNPRSLALRDLASPPAANALIRPIMEQFRNQRLRGRRAVRQQVQAPTFRAITQATPKLGVPTPQARVQKLLMPLRPEIFRPRRRRGRKASSFLEADH
jgi:hypothetical protein